MCSQQWPGDTGMNCEPGFEDHTVRWRRLRSRQLRRGEDSCTSLYNDTGHGFYSDFFYFPSTLLPHKKMPLQTNPSVDQVSVAIQLDTRHSFSYDARRCFPGSSPPSHLHLHHCLDQHTPLLSLRCLTWTYTPPFSLVIIITATHAMHIYYVPPNGPYINSLNFHDFLGLCCLELSMRKWSPENFRNCARPHSWRVEQLRW